MILIRLEAPKLPEKFGILWLATNSYNRERKNAAHRANLDCFLKKLMMTRRQPESNDPDSLGPFPVPDLSRLDRSGSAVEGVPPSEKIKSLNK